MRASIQAAGPVSPAGPRSIVACIGIAAGLLVSLTACGVHTGAARAGRPAPSGSGRAISGSGHATSPASRNKAGARAFDRTLLAGVRLPASARSQQSGPHPAALAGTEDLGSFHRAIYLTRYYLIPETTSELTRFVSSHLPAGSTGLSTGSEGGGSGIEQFVSYSQKSMPDAVAANVLVVSMLAVPGKATMVRVDARSIPAIPRSAAEHVSAADYRAVAVTMHRLLPRPGGITKVFTSRSVILRLARKLNEMSTASDLPISCPAFTPTYHLVFEPKSPQQKRLVAVAAACDSVDVSVSGAIQPVLLDQSGLGSLVSRMVGFGQSRPGHHLPS